MSTKTDVYLEDDVTGEVLYDEPGETIQFALDGHSFEFDASEATAKAFRDALAPYVAVARKAKKYKRGGKRENKLTAAENARIREAAKAAGVEISDRGRISNEVRAQFSHA